MDSQARVATLRLLGYRQIGSLANRLGLTNDSTSFWVRYMILSPEGNPIIITDLERLKSFGLDQPEVLDHAREHYGVRL